MRDRSDSFRRKTKPAIGFVRIADMQSMPAARDADRIRQVLHQLPQPSMGMAPWQEWQGQAAALILTPARIGIIIDHVDGRIVVLDVVEPAARDNLELVRVVDGAVMITRPRGGAAMDLAELRRRHGPRNTILPPRRKPIRCRRVTRRRGIVDAV
jgi:hypothetical protein